MHRLHEWAVRELRGATVGVQDLRSLVKRVAKIVRRLVPHDDACWHTIDPTSLIETGCFGDGLLTDHVRVSEIEYRRVDVSRFVDLARSSSPAAILSHTTAGRLERSARYREVYAGRGIAGELRVVFGAGGSAWGCVTLIRLAPKDFASADADALSALSSEIGGAMRTVLARDGRRPSSPVLTPSVVVLDAANDLDDETYSVTPWRTQLITGLVDAVPYALLAVADRARALLAAGSSTSASSYAPTGAGRWAALHAMALSGHPAERVAVVIQDAAGSIAPVLEQAYDLTARQRAVSDLVIAGFSTSEIADLLYISRHTVQQHLKAVFAKTGARSRRELVVLLSQSGADLVPTSIPVRV